MALVAEILASLLIVLGGGFALVGSWGLVRLPSLMTRLHGPTKATTLGVGGCLIASMIYFPMVHGDYTAHELLITLFLFLTAPVSANMIAKAHLHEQGQGLDANPAYRVEAGLPSTGTGTGWATFWAPEPVEKQEGTEPQAPLDVRHGPGAAALSGGGLDAPPCAASGRGQRDRVEGPDLPP